MKATVLLLLSMSGWCLGLYPGLEYQYRYSGRVVTGLIDVRPQISAAGIQATVTVQMLEDYVAIVQFSNVEVGDFHGDFTCDVRMPVPMEYHHLQEGIELLEKPFKVYGNGTRVFEFLEVPVEPVWITNIRKAVVNVFRYSPFVVKIEERGTEVLDFSAREDTMFGRCLTWYNVYQLSEDEAARVNHEREQTIETDVQRDEGQSASTSKGAGKGRKTAGGRKGTKTSHGRKGASKTSKSGRTDSRAHSVDDTLWGLHRTVDFEECEDLVEMKSHVTPSTEALFSRSSIGTYLIRGDTTDFRLERAVIEGSITMFTQDDHKEHIDTFTNQTIELKAVRMIEEELTIEYTVHKFHSWHYEVDQSLIERKVEGDQPGLEQVLTGVTLTEDMVAEIKEFINKGIQDLSDRMPRNPTHTTNLVSEMNHVVDAISILNYQQIRGIYNQYVTEYREATSLQSDSGTQEFHSRKIFILKEALYAAGTEPAILFFLNKINEDGYANEDRETINNFFLHLPTTIKSPKYIPQIMEVVMAMEWNEQHPDDKAIALITFSKLLSKMCLSPQVRSEHWDTTCSAQQLCHLEDIIHTYIPYLQQGLEDEEAPWWRRYIYLQALSTLSTPHIISVLQPYIMGARDVDIQFRTAAIWSLAKPFMHAPTAISKVMEMLMSVFENVGEHHEVRSVAFLVMGTWEVNIAWWQQMAATTWRDPSHKVANFISTTIKTTAHLSGKCDMAGLTSRVEHLAKPADPLSISHSVNYYLLEYLFSSQLNKPISFAWLANGASLIPSSVYLRLKLATFLGFTHEYKIGLQQVHLDRIFVKLIEHLTPKTKKATDPSIQEIIMGMYEELKENIGFESESTTPEKMIMLRVERMISLIFTFTNDQVFDQDFDPMMVILGQRPGFFDTPHYYRYLDAFMAIPNDLGLPFIAKHTGQNAWWFELSYTSGQSTSRGWKGSSSVTFDGSRMLYVEAKTLIPWSKKFAVATASEHLISVLLPFKIDHSIHKQNYELQLTFEPLTNDKFNLLEVHNIPITIQHGAFPTVVHYGNDARSIIFKHQECQYNHYYHPLSSAVGLWVQSHWSGDIPSTFTIKGLIKGEFNVFTPTLQTWDYHLTYDPEASTTKSFTITFTYVSTDKTSSDTNQYTDEFTGQTQGDYSDYSQFSQSSSDYQTFGDADVIVEQQSPTLERISKLQDQLVPSTGGHVRSVSIDFSFRGEPNKEYEAVLTWAAGVSPTKKISKIQFTWIEDVPQGVLAEPHATCLNMIFVKPNILPLSSMEEVFNTDFNYAIKAYLHDGVDCEEDPVLNIEGSMDVSQTQLDESREKMREHCGAKSDYLPIDMITSPIYDHVHFKAHWTEALPIHLKNLTYYGYDLIRGSYFPDISHDYTATNPDHEVEIDATKCLDSHRWTIHSSKPHEVSIIEDVESPYVFDVIASPTQIRDTFIYNFFNGRQHHACVLDHHQIRTFDGLVIPYEPDDCWNVISMDITGQDYGTLEVRFHEGQWEARVLFTHDAMLLEVTKSSLKLNGEDFNGRDHRFDIVYLEDASILTLPFFTHAVLKITSERVFFLEEQTFRGWIGGVCGNFDGEISADMIGPKGCVYTDPDLFIKSWTNKGEGCSGFSYLGRRRPVEAYQDACPHQSHVPTGVQHPNTLNDCMEWEYQERTESIYRCKAIVPTPKCKPGCNPVRPVSQTIKYDCTVIEEDSHYYEECHPHEYVTEYPGSCIRQ